MAKDQSIAIKDAVHKLQLSLLDGIKDENQLFAAGSLMSRSDYEDVVTERTIANFCGYPLCCNSLPSETHSKGRYRISLKEHKVYDLQETNSFCSSSCLINSRAFAESLQEKRCSVFNPIKLHEILSLFQNSSLDDSVEEGLGKNRDLGLSELKILENLETQSVKVSVEEWMGPSTAIEGYVPQSDCKTNALLSKHRKEGSNAKPSSKKDFFINEMDFTSTIITSDEYSISKMPSGLHEVSSSEKLEKPEQRGSYKVLGSSSVPAKKHSDGKSKKSKGKVKITGKEDDGVQEVSLNTFQDGSDIGTAGGEKRILAQKAGGSNETLLKPSLKTSGSKKLSRSVTWADEKTDSAGSGNLCEVREIKDTKVGSEAFTVREDDDGNSIIRIASAEACALALSQAAEAVASGGSDVSDAVAEAGIVILPPPHDVDEEEPSEGDDMPEPEPAHVKWPKKPGIPHSDLFDPQDSWFDAPPDGFSLALSTFATMWNALFGWITSSSLAYIYGKDESFHEEYLFVNGKEYPRKTILGDGRSSEIKETLAGCLGRALPVLTAVLGLPTPISDMEKGMAGLLDTMSFVDALPAFRTKHWQVIVLLFIDSLSVCRIPAVTPYMTNGRLLLYKILDGAQISMEEYEIMKDLLMPLGRAPQFSTQSGA